MIPTCSEEAMRSALEDDDQIQIQSDAISKEICLNRVDISTLVESLSFALTATEVKLRAQGTKLLSTTLTKLPADFLSTTQLHFIVQFFCDRTKDHHSVIPTLLPGILGVVSMTNVPAGSVAQIMRDLFKNVSCQSQVREDRQIIFNILQIICARHVEELLAMGSDFVYGVINAIDGERDPRILFSIFDFLPLFLRTFPLVHLAEEMFEVCACYFPVDFHPSPDDPTSISRDGLAARLSRCMCGHPEFAEFCIPLALEKLNSQLTVAKLDSLNLLILGAQNFPADKIESQFKDIWDAVHLEIRIKDDKPTDISILALSVLRTIVQSTSFNELISQNILTQLMDSIIHSVCDPDSKHFTTSNAVAITAATASKISALFVANKLLPLLILQTELYRENAQRLQQIRELISRLIEACVMQKVTQDLDESTVNSIRSDYMVGLASDRDEGSLLNILLCLTRSVKILNEHNRLQIYSNVNELCHSTSDQIFQQTQHLLIALATDNPTEFRKTFLEHWLQSDVVNATNAKQIFQTCGSLVKIPEFTDTTMGFLLNHVLVENDFHHLALDAIESLLVNGIEPIILNSLYLNFNIVQRLGELMCSISPSNPDFIGKVSNCVRLIVQQLDCAKQASIIAQPFVTLLNLTSIGELHLAASIIAAVRPEVVIDVEKFGLNVARHALQNNDEISFRIECQLLSSVANKALRNEQNDAVMMNLITEVQDNIESGNANGVRVLAWIAKGLLVGGDSRADSIVSMLMDLLDSQTLGEEAVDAFNVITLDPSSLHVVRPLYKQKLYHTFSGRFLKGNTSILTKVQLRAFAYIIRMVPYQVLNLNIEKVGPILFKYLDDEDLVLVNISIQKIDWYLSSQHDYFRAHLQHLVQSFLQLTAFKTSMKIRVAALNALQTIAKYPPFVLLPLRGDVLLGLQTPLDDPKRLVRNSAVIARNRWFLIGVPVDGTNK